MTAEQLKETEAKMENSLKQNVNDNKPEAEVKTKTPLEILEKNLANVSVNKAKSEEEEPVPVKNEENKRPMNRSFQQLDFQTRIYVGNIPYRTSEAELFSEFEPFGTIVGLQIARDLRTNQSRGFALIEFQDQASAFKAFKARNETQLRDRKIYIQPANKRSVRENVRKFNDVDYVQWQRPYRMRQEEMLEEFPLVLPFPHVSKNPYGMVMLPFDELGVTSTDFECKEEYLGSHGYDHFVYLERESYRPRHYRNYGLPQE